MRENIKAYYYLAKPGIIYGNLFTAAGGFLYGANRRIDFGLFIVTLLGTALIMASGCVVNNYFDRDIDTVMKRTKKRALVTGVIAPRNALYYAAILGVIGFGLLALYTNALTFVLGVIAFLSYSFIYTFAKRKTVHATIIGTLPGALPPVAAYTAATNRLDVSAWLLLIILACWQVAHFYSIAIFRLKDYKAAKIPVMPAKYGIQATKIQMIVYGSAFLLSLVLLSKYGYAGMLFLAVMFPLGLWWLYNIALGPWTNDDVVWARKTFFVSLVMLPALSVMLALNAWVA